MTKNQMLAACVILLPTCVLAFGAYQGLATRVTSTRHLQQLGEVDGWPQSLINLKLGAPLYDAHVYGYRQSYDIVVAKLDESDFADFIYPNKVRHTDIWDK